MPIQTQTQVVTDYHAARASAITQAYHELSRATITDLGGTPPADWAALDATSQAAVQARVAALIAGAGGTGAAGSGTGVDTVLPAPAPAAGTMNRQILQYLFESVVAALRGV